MPKKVSAPKKVSGSEGQLHRLRAICERLAGTTEKLSHGEPTFFVNKRVYASFANNHHNDGHIGAWIAAEPGIQGMLIQEAPNKFYRPPYVGVRGWVGVDFDEVDDDELFVLIRDAWKWIASK